MTFDELVAQSAVRLFKQKLLPLEFLHSRFVAHVQDKKLSFHQIHTKYAPWIIDDGVCFGKLFTNQSNPLTNKPNQ